jgi:hypothetical protein
MMILFTGVKIFNDQDTVPFGAIIDQLCDLFF